jgi:uncharacterized protein YutE (UPF0331/DUF86 family)
MNRETIKLIRNKLAYLDQTLAEIAPYLQIGYAQYSKQPAYRRATERLVQVIVEVSGDTNALILRAVGQRSAQTMRESFAAIRDLGVIDNALFERFNRTYVGLRNRIVHDYDTLDDRILFNSAKRLHKDAQEYLKAVVHYLEEADR